MELTPCALLGISGKKPSWRVQGLNILNDTGSNQSLFAFEAGCKVHAFPLFDQRPEAFIPCTRRRGMDGWMDGWMDGQG